MVGWILSLHSQDGSNLPFGTDGTVPLRERRWYTRANGVQVTTGLDQKQTLRGRNGISCFRARKLCMAWFSNSSDRFTSKACWLVGSLGLNLEGILDCGTLRCTLDVDITPRGIEPGRSRAAMDFVVDEYKRQDRRSHFTDRFILYHNEGRTSNHRNSSLHNHPPAPP